MANRIMFKLWNFWPPFLGAGIRIKRMSKNYREVDVQMKLSFFNRNYVGVHFGGSLYAMADPFFMLMLIENLGTDYIVWDKSAEIKFLKPARGVVKIEFRLSEQEILAIKQQADTNYKVEPEFIVSIIDENSSIVAEVVKKLYVRRKKHS